MAEDADTDLVAEGINAIKVFKAQGEPVAHYEYVAAEAAIWKSSCTLRASQELWKSHTCLDAWVPDELLLFFMPPRGRIRMIGWKP